MQMQRQRPAARQAGVALGRGLCDPSSALPPAAAAPYDSPIPLTRSQALSAPQRAANQQLLSRFSRLS